MYSTYYVGVGVCGAGLLIDLYRCVFGVNLAYILVTQSNGSVMFSLKNVLHNRCYAQRFLLQDMR